MQFKHPELLYALFLLIIPILIHLFQLRRFQKEIFTNVKFLKAVKLQTRKSAQLKKWLTLLTRLLLLTCLILAFAQPYIPNSEDFNETQETVIYLDNSFSMQAKGKNGSLLNKAVQDLLSYFSEDEALSLITNDKTYRNTTLKALKNDLIGLPFSNTQLDYETAILKGRQLFSNDIKSTKNLILVSDFQQKEKAFTIANDSTVNLKLVQQKPALVNNISIDSIFVSTVSSETTDITVRLSNSGVREDNVSLSLFNNDQLLTKSAISVNGDAETVFSLSNNAKVNGKIVLEDVGLHYDNTFYFNINKKPKIKVLAINENASDGFLKRIYTDDEFEYQSSLLSALDFDDISNQNLIVLNELENIPNSLYTALKMYKDDGGSILVIPSSKPNTSSYNQLFSLENNLSFTAPNSSESRITDINYNHPLLVNQFNTKVSNFQYPKVNSSFKFSLQKNTVLSFDSGDAFLVGDSGFYVFASALNTKHSNFKNSPLIVPILYNIGLQSLKLAQLYYTVGAPNTIAVNTILGQDDILSLHSNTTSTIPLQRSFSKSVELQTDALPESAGIYSIKNKAVELLKLSYNYKRDESVLVYHDMAKFNADETSNSLTETISEIKSNASINALWKWFAIFACICLIIEMLFLKFLK